ncbi:MAG: hypothetical protein JHD07_08805 [Bradyrhizobium sp.]|uniref:hypothetical protein n=1 Tax=Bradyrhizobium sp. TaxID=376 RepID=UPI001A1C1479|nr:hypothetical protein [Bradyrhizobium sp.]MBJ7403377.1 hypothetical protein [Bradyrhizobium sp.]
MTNIPTGTSSQAALDDKERQGTSKEATRRVFRWQLQVAADPELPALAGTIAIAISQFVNNKTGTAWPFRHTLAKLVGRSERAVSRAISAMVERGHLDRKDQGRDRPNLLTPILKDETIEARQEADAGTFEARHSPDDGTLLASCRDTFGHHAGTLSSRRTIEGTIEGTTEGKNIYPPESDLFTEVEVECPTPPPRPKRTAPTRFEEFYAAYPRHEARGAAAKAYTRIVRAGKTTEQELIDGATRYAAVRAGQDPRFTKLPASWLNAECWLDEASPRWSGGEQVRSNAPRPSVRDQILSGARRSLEMFMADAEVLQ